MRVVIVKVFGERRRYELSLMTIEEINNLRQLAKDFEIIEYREA